MYIASPENGPKSGADAQWLFYPFSGVKKAKSKKLWILAFGWVYLKFAK